MNVLNIKEKDILQFLIKNKERFVTSKELAEYLSCSDRTVRNVLKLIEKTMIIQGVRLISKQGQGYQILDLFGNCKKCYTIFMETVYDKAQKLNSKNFKLLIGVKKETFQLMLEHLNSAYQIQHRKGGRPRSLPMEDQLIMTLRYLRYYPTQRLLAFDFGVGVATVNAIITWVEDTLRASGSFDLDHLEAPSAAVAIDVTESPIQRPKKTKAKIILVKRNDTP